MTDLKYEFHQNNLLKSLKSCLVPFYQISFKITFENKDCISIHEVRLHEEKQLYGIQDKLCNSRGTENNFYKQAKIFPKGKIKYVFMTQSKRKEKNLFE